VRTENSIKEKEEAQILKNTVSGRRARRGLCWARAGQACKLRDGVRARVDPFFSESLDEAALQNSVAIVFEVAPLR